MARVKNEAALGTDAEDVEAALRVRASDGSVVIPFVRARWQRIRATADPDETRADPSNRDGVPFLEVRAHAQPQYLDLGVKLDHEDGCRFWDTGEARQGSAGHLIDDRHFFIDVTLTGNFESITTRVEAWHSGPGRPPVLALADDNRAPSAGGARTAPKSDEFKDAGRP